MKVVSGADVGTLASWFFTLREEDRESTIPYHRVVRIARGRDVLWTRSPTAPSD